MLLLQSLAEHVQPGSLLLIIDSPIDNYLWNDFDVLYVSECEAYSKIETTYRFEHYDNYPSKAQIAVLRKNVE